MEYPQAFFVLQLVCVVGFAQGFGWKRPCKGKYCYHSYNGRNGGSYRTDYGGYSGVNPFRRRGMGYGTMPYGDSAYEGSDYYAGLNTAFEGAFDGGLNGRYRSNCNGLPCKSHYVINFGRRRSYDGMGDYRSLGYMDRSRNLYGAGRNLGSYRSYSDLGSGGYRGRGIIGGYSMTGAFGRGGRIGAATTYSRTRVIGKYNGNGANYNKNNQNEDNSGYGAIEATPGYSGTRVIGGTGDYYSRNGVNVGSRVIAGYTGNVAAVGAYNSNTAVGRYRGIGAIRGQSRSGAISGFSRAGAIGRNNDNTRGAVALPEYSGTGDIANYKDYNGNNNNNDNSNNIRPYATHDSGVYRRIGSPEGYNGGYRRGYGTVIWRLIRRRRPYKNIRTRSIADGKSR